MRRLLPGPAVLTAERRSAKRASPSRPLKELLLRRELVHSHCLHIPPVKANRAPKVDGAGKLTPPVGIFAKQ